MSSMDWSGAAGRGFSMTGIDARGTMVVEGSYGDAENRDATLEQQPPLGVSHCSPKDWRERKCDSSTICPISPRVRVTAYRSPAEGLLVNAEEKVR